MILTGILVLLALMLSSGLCAVAALVLFGLMAWARWRRGGWAGWAQRQWPGALAATALSLILLGVVASATDGGIDPDVRHALNAVEEVWPLSLLVWLGVLALVWWGGWRAFAGWRSRA